MKSSHFKKKREKKKKKCIIFLSELGHINNSLYRMRRIIRLRHGKSQKNQLINVRI